jgi:voltage-gated potassium channel
MVAPIVDAPDPDREESRGERIAGIIEDRLDIPMAVLAVVWAVLVAYELVAPADQRGELLVIGNAIWVIFVLEFVAKLVVSGHPLRFLRRRWPAVIFLALPALRVLRVLRALRVLRVFPAARVVGSSYRAIGTARSLLGDRLGVLVVATLVVIFSGGQLLFVLEPEAPGGLGEALWWSANVSITGNLVFEPTTIPARLLGLFLGAYAVVVFASVAATLGAYFIEARTERAVAEDEAAGAAGTVSGEVRGAVALSAATGKQRSEGSSRQRPGEVREVEAVAPDRNSTVP